ncbi:MULTISPECIES: hypothetical protein [unclassified Paenibacillus]|uniref:hypothetical protein n=1 Tax=unclassified Paenibacillus TaxID=185978 RepID=UPI0024050C7C|nr:MULTISPECIES: hypothetical protein [unclassified Paenibacillus]MDF9839059.1 hypothetical protein [Paenibacillus sp. PastF-2]MDF9845641.1 hypothetical protein [Paenibacillus sp. PastM-2]MDF9852213.1 hypothetical protein [Paenibacillus sp. PastF-1]MDH6478058.1 hypothetical protein [Paenibacillus sp. PastH-2]MDH6505793.1 hypothetical protein [Paenibacillus sp. PastM-3]
MIRIQTCESNGYTNNQVTADEFRELASQAIERFLENNSDYFTVVRKGLKDLVVVTDGYGNSLPFSPMKLVNDLSEDFWIIVDDYRDTTAEALRINFILPEEY